MSIAILWVQRFRKTRFRKTRQCRIGPDRRLKPKKISGSHRDWLAQRCRERDFVTKCFSYAENLFADGDYAGEKLATAVAHVDGLPPEIVKRSDHVNGFVV